RLSADVDERARCVDAEVAHTRAAPNERMPEMPRPAADIEHAIARLEQRKQQFCRLRGARHLGFFAPRPASVQLAQRSAVLPDGISLPAAGANHVRRATSMNDD